jgi:prophage regulatory protein
MQTTFSALPAEGYARITAILAPTGPVPVSKSTWWAGIKTGRFPQPVKIGPRITAWRVSDIRELLQRLDESEAIAEREAA